MKIYIAAKFHAKSRLKIIRDVLRSWTYEVSSSWMDHEGADNLEQQDPDYNIKEGKRDIDEVLDADILIIDTLDESATGGRESELGMMLAKQRLSPQLKKFEIWLIGPKRQVFHYQVNSVFRDWSEILSELWKRLHENEKE